MPRYIDADKLVTRPNIGNNSSRTMWRNIERIVNEAPTADVVEVVRCKHCEHARQIDKTKSPEKYFRDDCIVCECEDVVGDEPMIYMNSHFCSYGERK